MRGAQQSIIIAFLVGIVATFIGIVVGAVAGYFRGWTESVLMRLTDVIITIPLILIAAVVGQEFGAAVALFLGLFLGLVTWPTLARLVRGEFLSLREQEFVDAARAVGASRAHHLPAHPAEHRRRRSSSTPRSRWRARSCSRPRCSFLGFGVKPPDISLGLLHQPVPARVQHASLAVLVAGPVHHHDRAVHQLHRRRPARRLRPPAEAGAQSRRAISEGKGCEFPRTPRPETTSTTGV